MAQTVMSDHSNAMLRQKRSKLPVAAHVLIHAMDKLDPEFDFRPGFLHCRIRLSFWQIRVLRRIRNTPCRFWQPLHTMQPGLSITGRQIKIPFLHISSHSISAFHPELTQNFICDPTSSNHKLRIFAISRFSSLSACHEAPTSIRKYRSISATG